MNDLSLLIYLAGALTAIKNLLFASGMSIIAGWLLVNFFTVNYDYPFAKFFNGVFNLKYPIIGATFIFISALIPDQQTMYMIAGSELGEVVIQSDEAKEVYDIIKDSLRKYAE